MRENYYKHVMTSVIIPISQAGEQLRGLLAKLRTQSVPLDIIVVDSSSSDEAADITGPFGARLLKTGPGQFDHGGTRTMAAGAASGDIIVYLSQDVLPFDDHSIENLTRPFEDRTVGAAYGRQLPQPDASPFGAHLRLFNYPEVSCVRTIADKEKFGIKTPFLSNAFSAYRKSALEEIGGFKERLIFAEDMYAGAKLLLGGYKIAYAADAAVYHSHNYSALQEFKRYFDIGVFHAREAWILQEFGRAEGEGMRYLRSGAGFLIKGGHTCLLPEFVLRNFLKYAGYTLGRNHEKIPPGIIRKISMHPLWWG